MENENDIYVSNLILKFIFLISLIFIVLDFIQIYYIFDSILEGYIKYPLNIFNECIKYQKIGDLFYSIFSLFSSLSATIISIGLIINLETFTNKFFHTFVYYNYIIFGPYLLISCFLSFYFYKDVAFTCSSQNYKKRVLNFSSVICFFFSFSFSLIVTIVGSFIYNIKLVMESINSDRNGNFILRKLFWEYIFRFHGINHNENNHIGLILNQINEDRIN